MTWLAERGVMFSSEPLKIVRDNCILMKYEFELKEDVTAFMLRFSHYMGNR